MKHTHSPDADDVQRFREEPLFFMARISQYEQYAQWIEEHQRFLDNPDAYLGSNYPSEGIRAMRETVQKNRIRYWKATSITPERRYEVLALCDRENAKQRAQAA